MTEGAFLRLQLAAKNAFRCGKESALLFLPEGLFSTSNGKVCEVKGYDADGNLHNLSQDEQNLRIQAAEQRISAIYDLGPQCHRP